MSETNDQEVPTVKNIKYKVFDYVQELGILQREKEELDSKIKELSDHIKSICHHPEDQQHIEEHYFEGSYLDQAYTKYVNRCQLCQTRLDETTKTHSWYG